MIGKRSNIDWSQHEYQVYREEYVCIYELEKKDTIDGRIKFINSSGILAVTGSYGNWIFCREFHPSSGGKVSDEYWEEKARIASCQKLYKWDRRTAEKQLKEAEVAARYEDEKEDEEFYQLMQNYCDEGEHMYWANADELKPKYLDWECVPEGLKRDVWLDVIFDAFDEMCRREGEKAK